MELIHLELHSRASIGNRPGLILLYNALTVRQWAHRTVITTRDAMLVLLK